MSHIPQEYDSLCLHHFITGAASVVFSWNVFCSSQPGHILVMMGCPVNNRKMDKGVTF